MQLFLLASGISLGFYGYFYAFCLLHIVVNNDILQRVLRSVTKNGEKTTYVNMIMSRPKISNIVDWGNIKIMTVEANHKFKNMNISRIHSQQYV